MSLVCRFDETGLIAPFVVILSSHERSSDKALLNIVEGVWANGRTNGPSTSSGRTVPGQTGCPP